MRYMLVTLLFAVLPLGAQLKSELRTNGKTTLKAFASLETSLMDGSAVFYEKSTFEGRRHVFFGTVVSSDGLIMTKASELLEGGDYSVRIGKTLYDKVTLVGRDEAWDVALMKVEAEGVKGVTLAETSDISQGTWVVANGPPTRRTRRVRVGIVSAHTRKIDPPTASIGVYLDDLKNELIVSEALEKGGAKAAGMEEGDQILKIDGEPVASGKEFGEAFEGKLSGDEVEVVVLRDGEEMTFEIELREPADIFENKVLDRNDSMSGEFSRRRADFPRVMQHSIYATPRSIGGPLLTLDGSCVGMNIARADRVTTFAIPVEEMRELIKSLQN